MFPVEDFVCEPGTLELVRSPYVRSIMVIGGVDTGKTTLVYSMARYLSESAKTSIVDLDVGQSHVGPPSTVGWGIFDPEAGCVPMPNFVFTGTFTPRGNLLPVLTGSMLVVSKARRNSDKVIIDTTGYIADTSARILKQQKIDALNPDLILGLQREKELFHILAPYLGCKRPKVVLVPVTWNVSEKPLEGRFSYRIEKLREYFGGGEIRELVLRESRIRFTRYPPGAFAGFLAGRLASLRSVNNRDMALGLVLDFARCGGVIKLKLLLPPRETGRFSHVLIGEARVPLSSFMSSCGGRFSSPSPVESD